MDICRPLQYQISSWSQLPRCKSNNSRDLSIEVTNFMQNAMLTGFRIVLSHKQFGVLFTCVIAAKGSLVSQCSEDIVHEFTTQQILAELAKYGYHIIYKANENLSGDQIQYLMTLQGLHYDKIRILNVWDTVNGLQAFNPKVVAFNAAKNVQWLNAGYSASMKEFTESLCNGSAMNLTSISDTKKYRWDWLVNFVANINDVIEDNSHMCTDCNHFADDPYDSEGGSV